MMLQFVWTTWNTSIPLQVAKETVEESVVDWDPEMAYIIKLQCKNVIREYGQMHNLFVWVHLICFILISVIIFVVLLIFLLK